MSLVWCFGGSVTALYAPGLAAERSSDTVVDHSLVGATTLGELARLDALIDAAVDAEAPPDVIVVEAGLHDALCALGREQASRAAGGPLGRFGVYEPSAVADRLRLVVQLVADASIHVVGLTPRTLPLAGTGWVAGFLAALQPAGDGWVEYDLPATSWEADRMHPNATGQAALVTLVDAAVTAALA